GARDVRPARRRAVARASRRGPGGRPGLARPGGVAAEGVHGRDTARLVAHEEAGAAAVRRRRADDAVAFAGGEEERDGRLLLRLGTQLREHLRPVGDRELEAVAARRDVDQVRDRLVAAAERPYLLGRARGRLRLLDRRAQELRPRPRQHAFVERVAVRAAVRARDEREAALRNRLEERPLAERRAPVAD